eukprot:TRINITY_DN3872_c0_g1_i6.p1 TRINITY_DN3872_c0_g1~~TRINITY_DN3872_c0_g1_i6.p1  ORF type:complete len:919 (+),score=203.14 TRINITY_DN3872_c0_g1_i6:78-2834(+)
MDPTSVRLIACGVQEMASIADLSNTSLLRVNLHGNAISSIRWPCILENLIELDLSANKISSIENLTMLRHLQSLNLSNNQIKSCNGLDGLSSLQRLNLSYNRISSLSGLRVLSFIYNHPLSMLDLKGNSIANAEELNYLTPFQNLRQLSFERHDLAVSSNVSSSHSNQICKARQYRSMAFVLIPSLRSLDNKDVHGRTLQNSDLQAVHPQLQAYAEYLDFTIDSPTTIKDRIPSTPPTTSQRPMEKQGLVGSEKNPSRSKPSSGEGTSQGIPLMPTAGSDSNDIPSASNPHGPLNAPISLQVLNTVDHELRLENLEYKLARMIARVETNHTQEINKRMTVPAEPRRKHINVAVTANIRTPSFQKSVQTDPSSFVSTDTFDSDDEPKSPSVNAYILRGQRVPMSSRPSRVVVQADRSRSNSPVRIARKKTRDVACLVNIFPEHEKDPPRPKPEMTNIGVGFTTVLEHRSVMVDTVSIIVEQLQDELQQLRSDADAWRSRCEETEHQAAIYEAQAQGELANKELIISQLKEQLQEAKASLKKADQRLDERTYATQNEYQTLQAKYAKLHEDYMTQSREKASVQDRMQTTLEQIGLLQSQNESIKKQLQEAQATIASREEERRKESIIMAARHAEEIASLLQRQESVIQKEKEYAERSGLERSVQIEVAFHELEAEFRRKAKEDLGRIYTLKAELDKLVRDRDKLATDVNDAKSKEARARELVDQLTLTVTEMKKQASQTSHQHQKEIELLKEKISKLENENSKHVTQTNEIKLLATELESTKIRLQERSKQFEEVKKQSGLTITELNAQNAGMQHKIDQSEQQISILSMDLKQAIRDLDESKLALEVKNKMLDDQSDTIKRLKETTNSKVTEADVAHSQLERQIEINDDLQREADDMKDTINSLKNEMDSQKRHLKVSPL